MVIVLVLTYVENQIWKLYSVYLVHTVHSNWANFGKIAIFGTLYLSTQAPKRDVVLYGGSTW